MATGYRLCSACGHRNAAGAAFCSACGTKLDATGDRTITLPKVDPLQDAPGTDDDTVVELDALPSDTGVLVVRSGPQAGEWFALRNEVTHLGRHPDSEISLDDITVSRRHAEIERTAEGFVVRDAGSLNGTYVNQERIDEAPLLPGDEIQVGKFRLVYLERPPAGP